MATRGPAQEVSDWEHILAIERSLGFKSQRDQLLCHRQQVPVFDELFTRIANLHPDYVELAELNAEQICEEALFQAQCDVIFDDLARSIWKGPEALWLVKETEHAEYGEGTSTDCFWTTSEKKRTECWRFHFHELVALYIANSELSAGGVVSVRPYDGPVVALGQALAGPPASSARRSASTRRGKSSLQATADGASGESSRSGGKRPQRDDDVSRQTQRRPMKAARKSAPSIPSSFRPDPTWENSTDQTTQTEGSTSPSPPPPKYNAPRKSAPCLGVRREVERSAGSDTDSFYRLTPGAERNSAQGATDGGPAHGTPASANIRPTVSNFTSPPKAGHGISTATEGVQAFEDRSVTAHDDFNGGENHDNNEPVVRDSPQINHEDGREDVIVISDDEDDGHQRNTSQAIPRATLGGSVPSSSTATAPRSEPQSSKTGIFAGRRARVSWGPQEPFDDILALSGCSSSNNLIQRIEAIKAKRQKIRHWQIAAAGVKFDGGACFRILWDDAGPAFEEMEEMLQGANGGPKFDLRFEIEWEDEEEGKPVKMEIG